MSGEIKPTTQEHENEGCWKIALLLIAIGTFGFIMTLVGAGADVMQMLGN